jgi:hypothetical protein
MLILDRQDSQLIDRLSPAARQEVFTLLAEQAATDFDFDAWLAEMAAFRAELQQELGEGVYLGALDLLAELREEAS